jgi:regulator of protease activity HflC (stomatin/prohibitin superfamily)
MWNIIYALDNKFKNNMKYVVVLFVVIFVIALLNPLVVIEAWHRWVVFSKFWWVKQGVLSEWIHLRIPLIETITSMDIRTKKILFTDNASKYPDIRKSRARLESASSDLQDVYVDAIVTYSLDQKNVSQIYQTVWLDYESKKVIPRVIDSIKTHTAKFKVAEILTSREKIKSNVEKELGDEFLKEGIILEGVSLTNFDFNPEFKKSIEEKQVAEQKKEKESYELERVAIQAQQKVKQAEAEKKAKILQWEGIEEYNRLIKQQINANVINYKRLENEAKAITKWNGQYPSTYFSWDSGAIPLINIWK